MKGYGEITKQIRIGKGYTQKHVAAHLLTQGAYSKFENKNTDINFATMHGIINRLGITFEEFFYIQNGYQYSKRDEIIAQFYRTSYNDEAVLRGLSEKCKRYLREFEEDQQIIHISIILDGLIILANTGDFERAKEIVEPVWRDLSKSNQLYIADLYMLNAILFLFPLPTVLQIKQFALRHIALFENFRQVSRLQINISMNIALLLMKDNEYSKAQKEILNAIFLCKKEHDFILLAICYVRKGICLNRLSHSGEKWIRKGVNMLMTLEQFTLLEMVEEEIKQY
ncbi:helix-turn-helix domain-containing protein [Lysinibacillus sp. NPDC093210]|uniref:helix-turn-helix domain-containing protein n=1 Tax=Lysinibacillus sp. NPDC093210 TaxID=3364133 RepID=UPI0038236AE9